MDSWVSLVRVEDCGQHEVAEYPVFCVAMVIDHVAENRVWYPGQNALDVMVFVDSTVDAKAVHCREGHDNQLSTLKLERYR